MRFILVLAVLFGVLSCKDTPETPASSGEETLGQSAEVAPLSSEDGNYDPATVDDELAGQVSEKLQEMFATELEIMTADDRNFRMYTINMDADPLEEVFVLFMSPYFCGSAGCNLLLLDDNLDLVTRFTVTRPPIFIEQTREHNWRSMMVYSNGDWRELRFDGTTYPSNPSVVEKAPYDAPSGNATVIFSNEEPYLPAKGYGF